MVFEEQPDETEHGLAATGDGWFVVSARGTRWLYAPGLGAYCDFEGNQRAKKEPRAANQTKLVGSF